MGLVHPLLPGCGHLQLHGDWRGDGRGYVMNILESQREMRSAFLGGFAGQLVSGLIWLVAAAPHTRWAACPQRRAARAMPSPAWRPKRRSASPAAILTAQASSPPRAAGLWTMPTTARPRSAWAIRFCRRRRRQPAQQPIHLYRRPRRQPTQQPIHLYRRRRRRPVRPTAMRWLPQSAVLAAVRSVSTRRVGSTATAQPSR